MNRLPLAQKHKQSESLPLVSEILATEVTSASQFQLCITSFDDQSDDKEERNIIKDELAQAVELA